MDTVCCINCFSVPQVRDFVEESATVGKCGYCGSSAVFVRDVSEVGGFILDGFFRRYEDAVQQVGYCSAEGGYLLPTDSIDEILIEQEDIFGPALDDPQNLLEELVHPDGTAYVRKDPYGPPLGDPDEISHWDKFCNVIKNEQRFTALLKSEKDVYDESHPEVFLDHLADDLGQNFIWHFDPGIKIYRARIWNDEKAPTHKELTAPPPELTRSNRMSPVGISFFYGGLEIGTCINELRPTVGEKIAVAEFEMLKELNLLNLSLRDFFLEEKTKSIFDEDYVFTWEEYHKPFLRHFVSEISKPVRPSDADIEHTPTQVFTEFIRMREFQERLFLPGEEQEVESFRVQGIIFRSSLKKEGTNIVLFKGPDISTEKHEENPKALLLFKGYSIYKVTDIELNYVQM